MSSRYRSSWLACPLLCLHHPSTSTTLLRPLKTRFVVHAPSSETLLVLVSALTLHILSFMSRA